MQTYDKLSEEGIKSCNEDKCRAYYIIKDELSSVIFVTDIIDRKCDPHSELGQKEKKNPHSIVVP